MWTRCSFVRRQKLTGLHRLQVRRILVGTFLRREHYLPPYCLLPACLIAVHGWSISFEKKESQLYGQAAGSFVAIHAIGGTEGGRFLAACTVQRSDSSLIIAKQRTIYLQAYRYNRKGNRANFIEHVGGPSVPTWLADAELCSLIIIF